MDLNLNALIGATYLFPIALTLRKVYAPSFDMPEAFSLALARLDARVSRPVPPRREPARAWAMSGASAL